MLSQKLKEELKQLIRKRLTEEKEKVIIYSTYKLSPREINSIVYSIPLIKGKEVVNVVDPGLIGGIKITFGSKELDFTISSRIKNLKKLLESY